MTEAAESVVSARLLAMRFDEGAKLKVSMRLAMNGDKQQHLYPHPRIRALREDVTFLHRVNASPYVSPGFTMEEGNLAVLANIQKDPVADATIRLQSRTAFIISKPAKRANRANRRPRCKRACVRRVVYMEFTDSKNTACLDAPPGGSGTFKNRMNRMT